MVNMETSTTGELVTMENVTVTYNVTLDMDHAIQRATPGQISAFLVWMCFTGLLGSIGNGLIILYYPSRKRYGSFTNIFIRVLAILDFIACLFIIPYSILFEFHKIHNNFLCKVSEFVRYFIISGSLFVLNGVALERFYIICLPMRTLTKKHIHGILFSCMLAATGIAFPALWVYGVFEVQTEINYIYMTEPSVTCYINQTSFGVFFKMAIFVAFLCISLSLVILYTVMYAILLRYMHQRNRRVHSENTDRNIQELSIRNLDIRPSQNNRESIQTENCAKPSNGSTVLTNERFFWILHRGYAENGNSPSTSRAASYDHLLYMRQVRCANMLLGITLIFLLSWTPFWLTKLRIIGYNPLLHYMFFFNQATNIFVYLIYNKKFRMIIRHIFNFQRR